MIAIDETGAGAPIALLHGVGASRVVWSHVTPLLSDERTVLAPDLPGFGESDPAGPGFDLETVALALAAPLAELAGAPFDLLGNSLGGAVALQLAASRPELVRRLVLSAPAGFSATHRLFAVAAGRVLGPATRIRRTFGVPLASSPAVRRAVLYGAVAKPQRLPADDARMMLRASRGSTRIGAAVTAVLEADLRPQLEQLQVPLGLIWGTRDRVVPISALERIREIRPSVVVETIDDAAHVPQVERPREFVATLRRVLDRLA
jgi:pimeloyl-ACP methyl ester carboxylesterase